MKTVPPDIGPRYILPFLLIKQHPSSSVLSSTLLRFSNLEILFSNVVSTTVESVSQIRKVRVLPTCRRRRTACYPSQIWSDRFISTSSLYSLCCYGYPLVRPLRDLCLRFFTPISLSSVRCTTLFSLKSIPAKSAGHQGGISTYAKT